MFNNLLTCQQRRALLVLPPIILLALLVLFFGREYRDNIGFIAACCTTFSFVPQVWQTLKTRDTSGISLGMYTLFVFGVFCWLNYGLMNNDLPVVAANGVTLILASIILALKLMETPATQPVQVSLDCSLRDPASAGQDHSHH